MSLAEHNSSYSVAFKNVFDWISRIPGRPHWGDKDVFLMATAPGPKGGANVLAAATARFHIVGQTSSRLSLCLNSKIISMLRKVFWILKS